MEPRKFTARQKTALWLRASGVCAECGTALVRGWHADHAIPWSHGGRTTLANGQALCPACNLKKGDRVQTVFRSTAPSLGEWQWPLREWQEEAFNVWASSRPRDFLAVVTPGGGKTRFALRCAHQGFVHGDVERIVVVVPSDHLRKQWRDTAIEYGISLHAGWMASHGWEPREDHGIVITYQSILGAASVLQSQCQQRRTLVIFDEVHHAGDDARWGQATKHAFDDATNRLLLSGTPKRTDGTPIPFVQYLEDGRYQADYSYNYGRALSDSPPVCRPVVFLRYDGMMDWWSRGALHAASFRDVIPEAENSHRLTTAIEPHGALMRAMLENAHETLMRRRAGEHPHAGGLVVAKNITDAYRISRVLKEISHTQPVVATSDDDTATHYIARFRDSSEPWIVAVKMVSEGVDIPRLAVGVYATNVVTDLFFRQFVGRFVRWEDRLGDEQSAAVFIPDYEPLVQYAELLKEEEEQALRSIEDEIRRNQRERAALDDETDWLDRPSFLPGGSEDPSLSGITHLDDTITPEEWAAADQLAQTFNFTSDLARVKIVLMRRMILKSAPSQVLETTRPIAPQVRRGTLKGFLNTKVAHLAKLLEKFHPNDDRYARINGRLKKIFGQRRDSLSQDDLLEQLTLVESWVTALSEARRSDQGWGWVVEWEGGEFDAIPSH